MIRPVKMSDVPQLLEMYNYYIEKTVATFEETPLTEEEFAKRIKEISDYFPFLVFDLDGEILGYAYANTFRTRVSYRFTVETSVYIRKDLFRGGIGSQLYISLLDQCRHQGFHVAIGGITLPNEQSVKFHEKLGFVKAGHLHEVGMKFGEWRDVGFWELKLNEE